MICNPRELAAQQRAEAKTVGQKFAELLPDRTGPRPPSAPAPGHGGQRPPDHQTSTAMTHALEEQWAGIVKDRRGKEKTTSGAGIDVYRLEDLGVMKRAEFYAACVRGVLDQILKCSIYNPADHTRMNSLYDKLIAYSVFVEHHLASGAVRVPYRDYKFSKGADWKQRYQLLKTGWMVGMQSRGVAEMAAAWREEDGETPDESEDEEQVPDDLDAVVEAYDQFRTARKTGKAAGPEGFSFECVKRRGGASAGALDFYAHSRCGKKIRSRRMLVSFLVV